MDRGPLDTTLCHASVSAISWYQSHVSPRKGFACAYRVRTGGESCSQFARQAFASGTWWTALRAVVHRFRLCGNAARAVRRSQDASLGHQIHDEQLDGVPIGEKPAAPRGKPEPSCDDYVAMTAMRCCLPCCFSAVFG